MEEGTVVEGSRGLTICIPLPPSSLRRGRPSDDVYKQMERLKEPEELWPCELHGEIPIPMSDVKKTEPPASTSSCEVGQEQLNGNHEEIR